MTEPQIKAGMHYGTANTKYQAMQNYTNKYKQSTISKTHPNFFELKNKDKLIGRLYVADDSNYATYTDRACHYTMSTDPKVLDKNNKRAFDTIFSRDGQLVAHDKNGDGIVQQNEIELNVSDFDRYNTTWMSF